MEKLSDTLVAFIQEHCQADTKQLLLQAHRFPEIPMSFAVTQIEARKKAEKKLPEWVENKWVVFPNTLAVEQASSELTAKYKASVLSGNTFIDCTGGLGVDTFYMAKSFEQVTLIEQQESLCQAAQHNFEVLQATNITVKQGDGISFVENLITKVDCIYLDPARRGSRQQRVFNVEDCQPNVLEHIEVLLEKAKQVVVKLSPMLDLQQTLSQLPQLKAIHIISVKNEVKEILLFLSNETQYSNIEITCALLHPLASPQSLTFAIPPPIVSFLWSIPLQYLYEPDAAIMKTGVLGGFSALAQQFELQKLHPNSHLFTSALHIEGFLGRGFKVESIVPFHNKNIKKLKITQANIATRNFPLSVQEIRKKTKWKEGGDLYIFATTLHNGEKVLLLCEKLV